MGQLKGWVSTALIVVGLLLVLGTAGLSDTNSCEVAEIGIRCVIGIGMIGSGLLLKM